MREDVITPIQGTPDYVKSGYICIKQDNLLLPVCKLSKEVFWDEQFQFIFEPDWEAIDKYTAQGIFHGINGLCLDLRKDKYYRVNIEPQFLVSRTPSNSRADLHKLLRERGLTYYDRMDFIDRTTGRFAIDNLTFRYELPEI